MRIKSSLFRIKITFKGWLALMKKPQPKRKLRGGVPYYFTNSYFWQVVNNHKSSISPWDHQKYVDDENELDELDEE